MTTSNDPAQLVSPESRAILGAADLYAVQRPNESHLFNVFDADGDYCFACTANIDHNDLGALIDYGKREHKEGYLLVADTLRHTLRELLQVDRSPRYDDT